MSYPLIPGKHIINSWIYMKVLYIFHSGIESIERLLVKIKHVIITTGLWFLRFFADFRICYKSPLVSTFSWKKRSCHQGKKEVACIVSKPLVSCLWWCWECVNPPKLNIQEVQGGFVLQTKGRPRPATHFLRIFHFCQITTLGCTVWMISRTGVFFRWPFVNQIFLKHNEAIICEMQ